MNPLLFFQKLRYYIIYKKDIIYLTVSNSVTWSITNYLNALCMYTQPHCTVAITIKTYCMVYITRLAGSEICLGILLVTS